MYRGEWIAFTGNGVIAHDREYLNTIAKIEPGRTDFVLARVHEYDCWEPPKFRGVRFRSMQRNDWQPRTIVQINKSSQSVSRDRGSTQETIDLLSSETQHSQMAD